MCFGPVYHFQNDIIPEVDSVASFDAVSTDIFGGVFGPPLDFSLAEKSRRLMCGTECLSHNPMSRRAKGLHDTCRVQYCWVYDRVAATSNGLVRVTAFIILSCQRKGRYCQAMLGLCDNNP
jgi:hypothetical protein